MTYRQAVRLQRGKEAVRVERMEKKNHYKAANDNSREMIKFYDEILKQKQNE